MYGQFVLLSDDGQTETARRIYLNEKGGDREFFLRDTLLAHPEIIPIDEIDATFGELVPLCRELRTTAGPVDAAFINRQGRLTLVECKLWDNPEARRKVVAQALDYVGAISNWTYADLQRQVSAATGRKGNVPFEVVSERGGTDLREAAFIDAVSRSLKEGRFLVIIAGDGIREGVRSLTDLVTRSASKAFSFALLEVAVFELSGGRRLVQPRLLAQSELFQREYIFASANGQALTPVDDVGRDDDVDAEGQPSRGSREKFRSWWNPIVSMKFDDPEQGPPQWAHPNNVSLELPFPGVVLKAWSTVNGRSSGIFLSARQGARDAVRPFLERDRAGLALELPLGAKIADGESLLSVQNDNLTTDEERYAWLEANLNSIVNLLRPRMRAWVRELQDRG